MYLVLGADALYPGDARELQQHCAPGTRIFNTYGITEATIDSTCYKITGPVSGELYIGGHSLARGYLNRADLMAERYIPNPFSREPGARLYKTGDRATWLAEREGRGPVLHRIEDMARIYIEQLRSVRKTGPYILGGWSFGGAVAFEMARQLKNQNETIELLFLFDTALHSPRQSRPEIVNGSREALLLFAVELIAGDRAGVLLMQKLLSLPLPQLYKQVQALAERQGYIADNLSANQFQQLANIYQNNASAFLHY